MSWNKRLSKETTVAVIVAQNLRQLQRLDQRTLLGNTSSTMPELLISTTLRDVVWRVTQARAQKTCQFG